jgi:hypothetical protein
MIEIGWDGLFGGWPLIGFKSLLAEEMVDGASGYGGQPFPFGV